MRNRICLLLLIMSFFTSCAIFEHRDFVYQMRDMDFNEPTFKAGEDFPVLVGDTGKDYREQSEILARTPATQRERFANEYSESLEDELRYLESKMTEKEYDYYELYKNKLGGTSEKIYFLSLSPYEKREYLRSMKVRQGGTMLYSERHQQTRMPASVQANIGLGMSMNDVLGTWGQPSNREYGDNQGTGNERWTYSRGGKTQYLYFEGGQVAGWQ